MRRLGQSTYTNVSSPVLTHREQPPSFCSTGNAIARSCRIAAAEASLGLDVWCRPLDVESPPRIAYTTRLLLGAPHRIGARSRLTVLGQHRTTESGPPRKRCRPWVAQRECCPAARPRQRSDAPVRAQPRSRVLSNSRVH